jgi:hypothetical protein
MPSPEERPALPDTPQFSQDMERALVAAARAGAAPRPGIAGLSRRTAAGIAVAAAAAVAGVGIGIAVSGGQADGGHPDGGHGKVGHGGQIHAAFSVDKTGKGTVTVTLMRNYVHIDPAALRHALAKAGVPALVTAGRVCAAGPSAVVNQVLGPSQHLPDGTTVLTIVPAAIPRGHELSIGFFAVPGGGSGIHITVVPEKGRLTCTPLPQRGPGG